MVRRAAEGTLLEVESPDADVAILERAVSGREYVALLKGADPNRYWSINAKSKFRTCDFNVKLRTTVLKKVQCFLWNNMYYELQTFAKPDIGLTILRTELEPGQTLNIPSFLEVNGEITGLKQFSSYYISEHYKNANQQPQDWKQNKEMWQVFLSQVKSNEKQKQAQTTDIWMIQLRISAFLTSIRNLPFFDVAQHCDFEMKIHVTKFT